MSPRSCFSPCFTSADDGRLKDGVAAADRMPPLSFPSAPGSERAPLAFFDAAGREEQGRFGASKLNRREAACIAKVAAALLADVKPDDLGVITPCGMPFPLL